MAVCHNPLRKAEAGGQHSEVNRHKYYGFSFVFIMVSFDFLYVHQQKRHPYLQIHF